MANDLKNPSKKISNTSKISTWKQFFGSTNYSKRSLILAIILLSLPLTLMLVLLGIKLFSRAQLSSVELFFSPDQATLTSASPNTTLNLMLDPKSQPVGFTRIEISYDPSKIQIGQLNFPTGAEQKLKKNNSTVLSDCQTLINQGFQCPFNPNQPLPAPYCQGTRPCITEEVNSSTGKVIVTLGLDPQNKNNPPTSVFQLIQIPVQLATTQANQQTTLSVSTSSQLVSTLSTTEVLPFTSRTATLSLNPSGGVTGTPTPTGGAGLQGDINGDGCVNLLDYSIMFSFFGQPAPAQWPDADIVKDGTINLLDYSVLFANFGKGTCV